jgi:hypothetical protein
VNHFFLFSFIFSSLFSLPSSSFFFLLHHPPISFYFSPPPPISRSGSGVLERGDINGLVFIVNIPSEHTPRVLCLRDFSGCYNAPSGLPSRCSNLGNMAFDLQAPLQLPNLSIAGVHVALHATNADSLIHGI